MEETWFRELAVANDTKILLFIMDGLGGLGELQAARTPHLDALAARSECGVLDPVYPGVTPGSGPGHMALFGYDPLRNEVGRGVLSALGIGFELEERDIAARCNFATVDERGVVTDRRAGRISTEECQRLTEKIQSGLDPIEDVAIFVRPEKEHRACLVLRGEGLELPIHDTDPLKEGVAPLAPRAETPAAEKTARVVSSFLNQVARILEDERPANALLTRGYDRLKPIPPLSDLYRISSLAVALYPMYQGLARLVGMKVHPTPGTLEEAIEAVRSSWSEHDFFFLHAKETDARGEDGSFEGKVAALEKVDALLPRILELAPDVLAVSGDHSTPAALAAHSWHPVPVLLHSRYARAGATTRFDEIACASGTLGRMPMKTLMPQLLAHALRFKKYGA